MHTIKNVYNLDVATLNDVDVLVIKQNNTDSNLLEINLKNNNEVFNLVGCDVRVFMILPDRTEDFIDLKITNAEKGTAEFLLNGRHLQKNGNLKLEFIITHLNENITTKTVFIQIEKSIIKGEKIELTEQYMALTDALTKINIITSDETIYIPGPQGPQGPKGDPGDGSADLSNYYTKLETYNRTEIDDKVSNGGLDFTNQELMHQLEKELLWQDLSDNPLLVYNASLARNMQLETSQKKIISAINECKRNIDSNNNTTINLIGDLSSLTTTEKSSLVAAINSLVVRCNQLETALEEIANAVNPNLTELDVKLDKALNDLK